MDTSYQVLVHLAKRFQRRRLKCEKLTGDIRQTSSDGKSSRCLRKGERKMLSLWLLVSLTAFILKTIRARSNLFPHAVKKFHTESREEKTSKSDLK